MSAFGTISGEATRVQKESGRPARFLLIGRDDYYRLCAEPTVSHLLTYAGRGGETEVELLERYLDLKIVIDPSRKIGFSVLGDAEFEVRR